MQCSVHLQVCGAGYGGGPGSSTCHQTNGHAQRSTGHILCTALPCGRAPTRCPGGALCAGTLIGCLPNNMLAVHAGSKLGELSSFRELYSAVRAWLAPRLWYNDKILQLSADFCSIVCEYIARVCCWWTRCVLGQAHLCHSLSS